MKSLFLYLTFVSAVIASGCHAQVTPNPTIYACPAATAPAYTPLNQSTPTTALTYTDSKPVAGQYCYIAQSVNATTSQVSLPSNTAGPVAPSGTNSVVLNWSAPTSGAALSGYVLSRASATASTLNAPIMGTSTLAEVQHDTNTYQLAEQHTPPPPTSLITIFATLTN